MLTSTLTLFRSGLTSSTVPMNSAKGPSVTRTLWPFVKATRYFGASTLLLAFVVALFVYAFRVSLGNRQVFGGEGAG